MSEQPSWKERIKAVASAAPVVAQGNPLLHKVEELAAALNESPWLRAELRSGPASQQRSLIVGPKYRRDISTILLSFWVGPRSLVVSGAQQQEFVDEASLERFFVELVEKPDFPGTVTRFQELQREDVPGWLRVEGLLEADPLDIPVSIDAAMHNELAKRSLEGNVEVPFHVDVTLVEHAQGGTFNELTPYRFLESGGFGLRIKAVLPLGDVLRVLGDIVPLPDLPSVPGAHPGGAALRQRPVASGHKDAPAGYLTEMVIKDVRAIKHVRWCVEPKPGWNVVLGDNGSGKTTFLRAIALGLMLREDALKLPLDFGTWVRPPAERGEVSLTAQLTLEGSEQRTCGAAVYLFSSAESGEELQRSPERDVSGEGRQLHALFSAGFGPFRRFTGGEAEHERQLRAYPRVSRHLSLFDERAALSERVEWLKDLRFKELEDASNAAFLHGVRTFINQEGFLPNGVWLRQITSDAIEFMDGNGWEGSIEDLSDGYRSVLSLTFELLRRLAAYWGQDRVFDEQATTVVASGIVLIDEVDAHLHPSWQRRIGPWLRKHFPAIQFVVTTHSPLVCQAAEVGTVFRLPRPGMTEEGGMVIGVELDRLLYGDLVDAYGTEAMGGVGRSDRAHELLDRLAVLNRKETGQGLTSEERKEQRRLRGIFPAAAEAGP
ncbi:AAA family ATPase [Sorangium sp. So ce429]